MAEKDDEEPKYDNKPVTFDDDLPSEEDLDDLDEEDY